MLLRASMSSLEIRASWLALGLAAAIAVLPREAGACAFLWRQADVPRGVGGAAVRVVAVEAQPTPVPVDDGAEHGGSRVALAGESGATLWHLPADSGARKNSTSDGAGTPGRANEFREFVESIQAVQTGRAERIPRVAGVQDLHFDRNGVLWIATARGLWRLDVAGRLEDRSPAPGEFARFVHRVVSLPGLVLATTAAGAYVTEDGQRWSRLAGDLPLGPAGPIAARSFAPVDDAVEGIHAEVWLVVAGTLRRLELRARSLSHPNPNGAADTAVESATASGPDGAVDWLVSHSERVASVAGLSAGALPLQILLDLPEADVALVYGDAIALRSPPRAVARVGAQPAGARRDSSVGWEIVRPVLPAEARATWLAWVAGEYWLATDGGQMRAAALRGPFHRTSPPAGSAEVFRVAGSGTLVLAASARGLLVGEPVLGERVRHASVSPDRHNLIRSALGGRAAESDPPIESVQRAALRYLGLEMDYVQGLRRGVSRRGWLPLLNLQFGAAYDRDTADEYDQAFLSGAMRALHDRDRRRGRDFDANLSLTWALGDVAYDPEAIDLSREARQLITLRDDVLDQINQAYYERQSLLRALETAPAEGVSTEVERRKLRLRADELAAGLDGWTGGWFGRHREGGPARSVE